MFLVDLKLPKLDVQKQLRQLRQDRILSWLFILPIGLAVGMSTVSYSTIYEQGFVFLSETIPMHSLLWQWSIGGATKLAGSITAGIVFVIFHEKTGAKDGIIISAGLLIVSLFIQSLLFYTSNIFTLYVGRFLFGLARSIIANLIIIFMIEIAPVTSRGLYSNAAFGIRFFGMSLQFLLGLHALLSTQTSWVWLLLAPALIAAPSVFIGVFIPAEPSKPQFEASRRRSSVLYAGNDANINVLRAAQKKASVLQLLRSSDHRIHLLISLLLSACVAFGGYPVLMDYLVLILHHLGLKKMAANIAVVATVFAPPCAFFTGALCDRFGRRAVLSFALLSCFVISLLVTLVRVLNAYGIENVGLMIFGAILCICWFTVVVGILFPLKFLVGEIFDHYHQSAAFSLYIFTMNAFGISIEVVFLPLEHLRAGSGFALQLALFTTAALGLWLLLPETNKMSPEQATRAIQLRFQGIKTAVCRCSDSEQQPEEGESMLQPLLLRVLDPTIHVIIPTSYGTTLVE